MDSLTKLQRALLATVDPRKEFPLHDHMTFTDQGDGSITVGLPWTDFTVSTAGDTDQARAAFGRQYLELLRGSEAERDKVRYAMEERGYFPISKRN